MNAPVGRILVAAWVVLVMGGTFLAFAARGAGVLPGDLALTRSLQKLQPDSALGILLSYAGEVVWFLPIAALAGALLMSRWLAALFILVASLTSVFIGEALKLLVASPRPSAELVRVVDPQRGYGFPSVTAFLSAVILGVIGYLIWRYSAVVACGVLPLLAFLIGLSRVYVGEHWATDVVGAVFRGCLAACSGGRPSLVGAQTGEAVARRPAQRTATKTLMRKEEGERGDCIDADEHRALEPIGLAV